MYLVFSCSPAETVRTPEHSVTQYRRRPDKTQTPENINIMYSIGRRPDEKQTPENINIMYSIGRRPDKKQTLENINIMYSIVYRYSSIAIHKGFSNYHLEMNKVVEEKHIERNT